MITGFVNSDTIIRDIAYINFKRNEEKADWLKGLAKKKFAFLWEYPYYLFKKLIFDKIGLYATSPARVLTSVVVVYFFFTLVYLVVPYFSETAKVTPLMDDMSFINRLLTTMYYSAITFFTVGYGEMLPTGFLRFFASIEGFLGVFMMSYFTVAFARKILR